MKKFFALIVALLVIAVVLPAFELRADAKSYHSVSESTVTSSQSGQSDSDFNGSAIGSAVIDDSSLGKPDINSGLGLFFLWFLFVIIIAIVFVVSVPSVVFDVISGIKVLKHYPKTENYVFEKTFYAVTCLLSVLVAVFVMLDFYNTFSTLVLKDDVNIFSFILYNLNTIFLGVALIVMRIILRVKEKNGRFGSDYIFAVFFTIALISLTFSRTVINPFVLLISAGNLAFSIGNFIMIKKICSERS